MHPTPLNEHLSRRELFEAFKAQLAKDFAQCNFNSEFIATLPPDFATIQKTIADELRRSESRSDNSINTLLYRVDISESQIKNLLAAQPDQHYLELLAELIIKRILQKVVIREMHKGM